MQLPLRTQNYLLLLQTVNYSNYLRTVNYFSYLTNTYTLKCLGYIPVLKLIIRIRNLIRFRSNHILGICYYFHQRIIQLILQALIYLFCSRFLAYALRGTLAVFVSQISRGAFRVRLRIVVNLLNILQELFLANSSTDPADCIVQGACEKGPDRLHRVWQDVEYRHIGFQHCKSVLDQ